MLAMQQDNYLTDKNSEQQTKPLTTRLQYLIFKFNFQLFQLLTGDISKQMK